MVHTLSELTDEFNKAQDIFKEYVLYQANQINNRLFFVDVNPNELYVMFNNFCTDEGINPIYKECNFHVCNSCKHFFNTFGKVVIVTKSYVEDKPIFTKTSVFHILATEDTIYKPVFEKLEKYLLERPIVKPAIFNPNTATSLQPYSYETLDDGSRIKHNHFYIPLFQLPGIYVSETANQDIAKINANVEALLKLDERYIEPIEIVLEIIENTGLYRANEHRQELLDYLDFIKNTPTIIIEDYYNCVFYNSFNIPNIFINTDLCKELCDDSHNYKSVSFPTLINTALGQLIKNLQKGMDIEEAVGKYLNMVDAQNYQRPKKIITSSMVNQAEKRLTQLGYLDSIPRRYATIDDLPIQEVDYINKNNTHQKEESIFDELKKNAVEKPMNFDYVENEGYSFFKNQNYKDIELDRINIVTDLLVKISTTNSIEMLKFKDELALFSDS